MPLKIQSKAIGSGTSVPVFGHRSFEAFTRAISSPKPRNRKFAHPMAARLALTQQSHVTTLRNPSSITEALRLHLRTGPCNPGHMASLRHGFQSTRRCFKSPRLIDKWRLGTLLLPRFWQLHLASLLAIQRTDTELRIRLQTLAHQTQVRA